jgi:hypothetical protein
MTFSSGAVLEVGSDYVAAADVSAGITEKVLASGVQSGGAILSGGLVDVLAGGIVSGVAVSSGGKLVVFSGGTDIDPTISSGGSGVVSAGGLILAQSGGTAEIDGFLANSGALFASGSGSLVLIAAGAVVSGGSAVVGDGVVEVATSSSENVVFVASGNGGLVLDAALGSGYKGRVFGFGGVSGANSAQFIAFTQIGSGAVSYKPAAGNTSGTLTVASGGVSATVTLVGHYTSTSFSAGIVSGHVEITDPSTKPAHAGVAVGAATTLAYSQNGDKTGVSLTAAEGARAAAIALLGNYMAATFVTTADASGATAIGGTQPTAEQPPLLTHPQRS